MSMAANFATALLAEGTICPAGLTSWNGSDPAVRFSVYRNNVIVSLIDALADTYPVSAALVGEPFFRVLARAFARQHPPRSPVLAGYGEDFAQFVSDYRDAASVPYLADVARLEWRYVCAFHAADAEPLGPESLAPLLADIEQLAQVRVVLHPSLAAISSRYAIASLWAAHRTTLELATVVPELPEAALVLRVGLTVEVIAITPGTCEFITQLLAQASLSAAADAALAADESFDLAASLVLLISRGAIIGTESRGALQP